MFLNNLTKTNNVLQQPPTKYKSVMKTIFDYFTRRTSKTESNASVYFIEFIFQELNEFININKLLNTTKQFKEYKTKLFYWKLNKDHSFKYCNDICFHNCINSYILCRNKQLSINMSENRTSGNHLNFNLYLNNENSEKLRRIGNVHSLNLNLCDITDESLSHIDLYNVHTLKLSWCDRITDEGLRYLGNVHTLDLRYCNKITDEGLSHLVNIKNLDLSFCAKITDEGISYLGNCHTLDLSNCTKITDEGVKHLVNVHTLILIGCYITDKSVKHLGNCHTLNLSRCDITDEGIKHLGKVHSLNLSNCYKITNGGVKHLGKVHSLNLSGCDNITNECIIQFLANINMLELGWYVEMPVSCYCNNCVNYNINCVKKNSSIIKSFLGFICIYIYIMYDINWL